MSTKPAEVKPLPHPDHLHLQAAEGWLGLDCPRDALAELEQLAPKNRNHPHVLEVRWHIGARQKQWAECVQLAQKILDALPEHEFGWIHRSYALHELKRTQEAHDCLLLVVDKFKKVWTIPYNLACYCAQLGRMQECEKWFRKAVKLDEETVLEQAVDDPDLKPLRASEAWSEWQAK